MRSLPEIPLQDIVLGLASAALLLIAAYCLGRARPDRAWADDQEGLASLFPSLFAEIAPDRTRRGLSLTASLFLHLMGFAMVPWLQLMFPGPPPFRYQHRQAITLEYHIPLPPLLAPSELSSLDEPSTVSKAEPQPDGRTENPKLAKPDENEQADQQSGTAPTQAKLLSPTPEKPNEAAASEEPQDEEVVAENEPPVLAVEEQTPKPSEASNEEELRGTALAPKEIVKLVLPPAVETNPALRDVVLQPDFTVPLPDDYTLNLPPVLLWTQRSPKLQEKVTLEPTPGAAEAPSHMRLPELQPQLQPPNGLPTLAELQLKSILPTVERPKLPVEGGDVLPLKGLVPAPDALTEVPSLRGGAGSNSLMIFSQDPNIRTPTYELTPGLRLGSVEASPGEMPAGVVGGTESVDPDAEAVVLSSEAGARMLSDEPVFGPGSAFEQPGDGRQIRIVGNRSGEFSGVQIINLAPGLAQSGSHEQVGEENGLSASSEGPGKREIGQADGSESGSGRLKPLPRAKYGIILVSNAKGALPEAEGVLSGNPIYTVYFKVPESPRKWVLQYCKPKNAQPTLEFSDGVVRVLPRKKLDPPYALRKGPVRLNLEAQDEGLTPKRVVIYGTFGPDGRFENSRVVRGADPEIDQTILAALQSWEFLPAFAEGEPVLVEALLGVPLR